MRKVRDLNFALKKNMESIASTAVATNRAATAPTCPHVSRKQARAALQGKTVAFVGDSVSRMMFCETVGLGNAGHGQ